MGMEPKMEIYDLIPPQYIPATIRIKQETNLAEILKATSEADIRFPFICKPDIGLKGLGVDKIKDAVELQTYKNKISDDFLIQELITYPNEIGIFYVRFPDEQKGKITGLVAKEFLTVEGNGKDSILVLIRQNPRSYRQLTELRKKYGDYINTVLPDGEKFILVPYGSHTRGSKFIDITGQLNDKLTETINQICVQVSGFYFGRLDIRYASFDELSEGKNFSIIEINGSGSEPTNIYDPDHSLFFAWKELIRHWKLMYQISAINFQKGNPYLSFREGREMLKASSALEAQLKLF